MPRGKNYVNQNKGMFLQGRQKVTEACRYGAACTRSGCIYIHESSTPETTAEDSNAPCMAYLAGLCSFTKGCRRRHPSDQECERLVARYANLPCRYGSECRTQGCLYRHEDDDKKQNLPLPTLPVVVVKPTPVVSKSGAPLAEWMPAKSSSSSSLGGSALLPQNGSTTAIPPLGSNNPIAGGTSAGTTPTTGIPTIITPLQPMPFYPPPQPSGMTGFYPPPPMMMMMMHGYPPPYDEYNGPPPPPPLQPYGTAPPWYPSGPPLPPPYGGGGGGGPPSMIGSWKPAPIAQPQPMYYPSPPPPPPQLLPQSPPPLSWESEFPELSASNNGKNNNSIKNPDHSIIDTNAHF